MRRVGRRAVLRARALWHWYRGRKRWQQIAIAVGIIAILIALFFVLNAGKKEESAEQLRFVTLSSVGQLSGTGASVGIIGQARSVTEAAILAQAGGTVRRVNTTLGRGVGAGAIIAELENASERAAILQAEGAYDAAIAAREGTSVGDAEGTARSAYRAAFTALDTALESQVDLFYTGRANHGPRLNISAAPSAHDSLSLEREALTDEMRVWRTSLGTVEAAEPIALLSKAETILNRTALFLDTLSRAANRPDSDATDTQLSALATARTTVNAQLAAVASARSAFRSNSTGSTASADASVKTALGGLRAAQAALEKTIIRAPIGGTVNFLPIRVGDYVTSLTHVATVAQNGALEIVAYVSEEDRDLLAAGTTVTIEDEFPGVITSIAPALDPTTKQIEVRIAVKGATSIVNGQTVRIALPNARAESTAPETGPQLLPLTALKLTPSARVVFTLGEDGRLVAKPVEIGEVRGDRIEIRTPLPTDLRIVTDARGLSEGQKVDVMDGN